MRSTIEALVKPSDLIIPPRPQAMMVLMEEMERSEPCVKRIERAIQADPGLAGAMLKVVNSPAFGLSRKATSIGQAMALLGLNHIRAIGAGLAVRAAMGCAGNVSMERFWDTAEKVALICADLARCLRAIPPDEAYTFGLFHDCGIPLLMCRHPDYREALAKANHGEGDSFTRIEERCVGTHHGAVGYFVAHSWHLPDETCKAILWHHDLEVFDAQAGMPDKVLGYIGLMHLAEHIHHRRMRSVEDVEWLRFRDKVLAYFGLSEEDYLDLIERAQYLLSEE